MKFTQIVDCVSKTRHANLQPFWWIFVVTVNFLRLFFPVFDPLSSFKNFIVNFQKTYEYWEFFYLILKEWVIDCKKFYLNSCSMVQIKNHWRSMKVTFLLNFCLNFAKGNNPINCFTDILTTKWHKVSHIFIYYEKVILDIYEEFHVFNYWNISGLEAKIVYAFLCLNFFNQSF